MDRKSELLKILKEEYGIESMEGLDRAIRELPKIDISVFCGPIKGKGIST